MSTTQTGTRTRRPYRVQFFDRWTDEWVTIATYSTRERAEAAAHWRRGMSWYQNNTTLRVSNREEN